MGGAGGAGTTEGTGTAPAIVEFVCCNWEYACISWQIAALYWFKALFWNRYCEDTGNVDLVGALDAWAWTVAVGRAGEGNSEVQAKLYRLRMVQLAELKRQRKMVHQDSSNDVKL